MATHTVEVTDGSKLDDLLGSWNSSRNAVRQAAGDLTLTVEQDINELVKETVVCCEASFGKDLKTFDNDSRETLNKKHSDDVATKKKELISALFA